MKLRRTPVLHRPRCSAEKWVAHSLINTAARFLLRPLASFYYSTFTFNDIFFSFSSSPYITSFDELSRQPAQALRFS